MNLKNVITWKDADQNLCTVAAYMLSEAAKAVRSGRAMSGTYPAADGEVIFPGFGEEGSIRTVFSGSYDPHQLLPSRTGSNEPCPQCWWCFQNIITNRLREARAELADNLYSQRSALKRSKQLSRNRNGRKARKSKFGRKSER